MNPEQSNNLEAKLTALLLGELPASEAFELGRAIEHDPELTKIYQRLEKTIGLVKETAAPVAQEVQSTETLQLSDKRREALAQHFKTVRPKAFAKTEPVRAWWRKPLAVAAVFVVFVGGPALIVTFLVISRAEKRSVQADTDVATATLAIEGAKQQVQTRMSSASRPARPSSTLVYSVGAGSPQAFQPTTAARTPIVLPAPETTPASAGDRFYTVTAGSGGEQANRGTLALGSDVKAGGKLEWIGAQDRPAGVHSDTNVSIGSYAYAIPQTQWGATVAGVNSQAGDFVAKDADGDAIRKRVDYLGNGFTPSAGPSLQGGTAPAPAQPGAEAALTARAEQPVAQASSPPLMFTGIMNQRGNKVAVIEPKPGAAGQTGSGGGQGGGGGGSQGSISLANPTATPSLPAQLTEGRGVGSVEVASVDLPQAIDPATGLPLPNAAPAATEEKARRPASIGNVNRSRLADAIDPATGLPIPMPEVAVAPETASEPHVQSFEVDPSKLSRALETVARPSTPVAQPNGIPRVETAGGGGGGGGAGGGGTVANVTRTNNQIAVQENMRKLLADSGITLDPSKGESAYFNDRTGKLIVSADEDKLKQIDAVTQELEPPSKAAGELSNIANLRYSPSSIGQLGDVPFFGRLFTNATTSAGKPPIIAQSAPPPIRPSPYAASNTTEDAVPPGMTDWRGLNLEQALAVRADLDNKTILRSDALPDIKLNISTPKALTKAEARQAIDAALGMNGISLIPMGSNVVKAVTLDTMNGFGEHGQKPTTSNALLAGDNSRETPGRSSGGRTESESPRQQIVLPPAEQQLALSDDVSGKTDWFEADNKKRSTSETLSGYVDTSAQWNQSTGNRRSPLYRATTQAGTAVSNDGWTDASHSKQGAPEIANGNSQELNRSKLQDESKNSGTPGNVAPSFSSTAAQAQKTPDLVAPGTFVESRQKESPSNVYSQNIVGYANVAIRDGKSFYANPFTNKPESEKQIATGVPSQIAQQEKEVERLRKELKVPDSLSYADSPSMLLTAEAVLKLDAQRVELEAALAREKTVLTNLSGLPKTDLEKVLPTTAPDNLLKSLLEQRSLNEEALAKKTQSYGETNADVIKTRDTIDELNRRISERVDGIMTSLGQRVKASENSLEALTIQVESAKRNDIASASAMRPYFDARNKLEELKRFHTALAAKSASESIQDQDALPKSRMVTLMDPANSENATSSLWDKLQGKYETKARIKIESDRTDIAGVADHSVATGYDPYFARTELETIQSDAVLGRAVTNLNLSREWARTEGKDAVKKLRKMLNVKPTKGTSFVDIGVKADKPEESARLANAVAEAYQDYRKEEARELSRRGIAALNESIRDQEKRIADQQAVVDKLREDLKVPASVARPDVPALITQNRLTSSVLPQKDPDLAPRKASTNAPVHRAEIATTENAFSTFSLNVSDVSFKLAMASLEKGALPEPASVRSEEFINAFDYRDPEPPAGVPVGFAWDRAQYPFAQNRDVLRFSIKTAAQGRQAGSPLNLVLLLDNSGSMERADRVRIIHESLRVLAGQLEARDKLSVVLFSRTARLLVDGVSGTNAAKVAEEVNGLTPEGGTNLEEAMNLAYQTAARHYLANGINRVVLLTDGAANLGDVEPESLKQKVEANRKQGIALDCFGIGWEGYNDDLLEVLSRNGDGRYGFINSPEEAASEFAGQLAGALNVAASDVKVQVEFNPARVKAWRQVGYAKHQLTKEQFRDNTVDAAEIAAAESGNAVYVIEVNPNGEGPLGTVRVRFKVPGTSDYREHEWAVPYSGNAVTLEQSSQAMRLAATASEFSEWLAANPYAGEINLDRLLGYLSGVPEAYGADVRPRKLEWMLRQTRSLAGK